MLHRLLFLSTALLAACSSPSADTTAPPTTTEQPAAAAPPPAPTVAEQRHVFSAAAPDVFRLEVKGNSLLDAPGLLTISTAAGQEIYRQTLQPGELEATLVYELTAGEAPTVARRQAYVRRRVAGFFDEDNFRSPAVSPGAAYHPGLISEAEWRELQQPGTVGFSFIVGKEDGYRLAWLPSRKKVVRYASTGG